MRIAIVGAVGCGKTRMARKLSAKYDMPFFGLDQFVHDGTGSRPEEEVKEAYEKNTRQPVWIIEGIHQKNMVKHYERADVVVYLSVPKWLRLFRLERRYIKQKLHIENSGYAPNKEMLEQMKKKTSEFSEIGLLAALAEYKDKMVTVHSLAGIIRYLEKNKLTDESRSFV